MNEIDLIVKYYTTPDKYEGLKCAINKLIKDQKNNGKHSSNNTKNQ